MTPLDVGGIALAAGLFGIALALVRRDYRAGGTLSALTVGVVWAAYALHGVVTVWLAATAPLGRLPLPVTPALLAGGTLLVLGIALAVLAIATFRSFARMSGLDTSQLVTGGVYAWSRNPQNLGWGLALLGFAAAGRSAAALAMVVLFAAVIHGYIVTLEEPYLTGVYGDEFRAYQRRVARYLGRPSESTRRPSEPAGPAA